MFSYVLNLRLRLCLLDLNQVVSIIQLPSSHWLEILNHLLETKGENRVLGQQMKLLHLLEMHLDALIKST